METQIGYIRFGKILYFEYYELPQPRINEYSRKRGWITNYEYEQKMKKYKASRREAEISNIYFKVKSKTAIVIEKLEDRYPIEIENNQACKAEVENNKAMIIKIT